MDLHELEVDRKLASAARRKPLNEASLIWSLVGVAFYLLTYYVLKENRSIPIPFGLSFVGACVVVGVLGGGSFALVHLSFARKSVQSARAEYAERLHQAQESRRAEVDERIRLMEEHEGGSAGD